MYFWNAYPFVRLTVALILGIILSDQFPDLWEHSLSGFLGLTLGLILSIFLSSRIGFFKLRHVNGILGLTMITFLGGHLTLSKYQRHSNDHYTFIDRSIHGFEGTIIDSPTERADYFRYEFRLTHFINDSLENTSGTIYLYIRKDSTRHQFSYGDILRVSGAFYPVPPPNNPFEFDYKRYLQRQNIFSHSFVNHEEVQKIKSQPPFKIISIALTLRKAASLIIDETIPSSRENAIAKALILGVKDYLDNDIKKAYSSAGAMHVLAVSGLHVGIIYLLIQLLFGKLKQHSLAGKRFFALLSIAIIWFYAMVTGLSPSVLRAATMFSLVAIGESNARKGNIYNTLGISAFLLLLFDPYLVYSVGFQLSYAAVFGIVYLQPRIYRLVSFRNPLLDKAWSITCVSIAAQMATFPLSAYYFHQFPSYFLVSNLIVIPAAFFTLLLGIMMLAFYPVVKTLGTAIGLLLEKVFFVLNEIMSWIEKLPNSLIQWIYIDKTGLILIYCIMITLIVGLQRKAFKSLTVSTALFLSLLGTHLYQHYDSLNDRKLVFYELKNKIAIDIIDGHSAKLLIEDKGSAELEWYAFQIDPNRLANGLPSIHETHRSIESEFQKVGSFKLGNLLDTKVLIFDSTTFHLSFISPITSDIILIENEATKNLGWLKKHFEAKHIILGNNNSYSFVRRMKEQASSLNIDIHSIKEDGAFTLEIGHKKRANHWLALFTTNPD